MEKDAICGPQAPQEAKRRYRREMAIAAVAYTLTVFAGASAAVWIAAGGHPKWWAIAPALAPVIPALFGLRAYMTFHRSMDELERRIQSEAMLLAAVIVGLASFSYGFLEEWAGFPHVPLIWVFPALIGLWGVVQALVRRRYL